MSEAWFKDLIWDYSDWLLPESVRGEFFVLAFI